MYKKVKDGLIREEEINEKIFEKELGTNKCTQYPLDLLIRPAGEFRLSNFLLYQSAYAELYFTKTLRKILCDGKWSEQDASVLVPGDIINIKLGDIIPTDARLLQGDPLKIDQIEIKKVAAGEDASELIANGKSHGREWLKGRHGKTASLASTSALVVAWTGVV
ncbi:hypothetical protein POM88_010384 [Heracleum sosnowskyi]|uniref:P-type ATPase A domain-containing protein n=1 Tax=Heracleum sosnowskyi TaxID=360622 RepID=A0AAD8IUA9_9APIA|nr:hypothetical protein POM88_010384 [Heracleum sosnowskyi]